jgi:hypothetical protein
MLKHLCFLLLLLPLLTQAQFTVSGKVINLYDKKPVVKASVFLSSTTVGGTTAEDGSYLLTNVRPGQYDIVVSAIGYETSYATIKVDKNTTIPYTELTPRTIDLKAVVVKPDPDWQQNYTIFKQEFLGESEYAQKCKILNPEVLNLTFDKKTRTLIASSNDYLEIENHALGYKLRYLLTEFRKDFQENTLFYLGNILFSPMQGKPSQVRRWYKNRLNAFLGSSEHYLRSVISKNLAEQGFKTFQLVRLPNPSRPSDSLIQAKLKTFQPKATFDGNRVVYHGNDSLTYWSEKNRLPKMAEYLITKPLRVDSIVKLTDQKGIYALGYKDVLYIVYTKGKGETGYNNRPMNAPNYPTSLMTIREPYAFFDNNGVIINPTSVMNEGKWASNRAANLLPVDYDPNQKYTKP